MHSFSADIAGKLKHYADFPKFASFLGEKKKIKEKKSTKKCILPQSVTDTNGSNSCFISFDRSYKKNR